MAKYYEREHSLIGVEKVLECQKWYENSDCPDPDNGEEDGWNEYVKGVFEDWWEYNSDNENLSKMLELPYEERWEWWCENTYTSLIIDSQLGINSEPTWEKNDEF